MTIPTIVKPAPASDKGVYSSVIAKRALIAGVSVLAISAVTSVGSLFSSDSAKTVVWESGEKASLMCSFDDATNPSKSVPSMSVAQTQYVNGFRLVWADGVNEVFEGTGTAGEMKAGEGTWSFDGSAQDFTLTSATGSVINCQ